MQRDFSEKGFFRQAFHGVTLAVALYRDVNLDRATSDALLNVISDLTDHGARVILFFEDEPLGSRLKPLLHAQSKPSLWLSVGDSELNHDGERLLLHSVWSSSAAVVAVPLRCASAEMFSERLVRITTGLRFPRLVMVDELGGLRSGDGSVISFLNPVGLEALIHGGDSKDSRIGLMRSVSMLLAGGVPMVSLCKLADLDEELFTYAGRGTFFSQHHYCLVRRLNWSDFPEVESTIRRGEREGFLLPRKDEQLLDVLMSGYGAFFANNHLAGVAGLLTAPYENTKAGEVVSLYTLTRFKGRGIGGRLLAKMKTDGQKRGLRFLFACTANARVVSFFQRHGYQTVSSDQIPDAKWASYDPARRSLVTCLRLSLEG
ncbi:MAG: GNAT family N-acetyltransferase [Magnetococcales bacterium]|nr:GNAT family N-acetyltransferase [Magnetococcales bacterium]